MQMQQKRPAGQPVLTVVAAADAPVERIHAREQLGGGERLRHIIVRTGHQTGDLVHFLALCAEHDDAHFRAGGADAAADLKAVDVRQHHVQQRNQNIRVLLELFQCFLACASLDRLIPAAAQIDDDKTADAGFVFENQNFFHNVSFPFGKVSYNQNTIRESDSN